LRVALGEVVERAADSKGSKGSNNSSGYDLLLVDCEPGLEIFSRGTLDGADVLIVVTEPTAAGLHVAAQIWQAAEELGLEAARRQPEPRPVLLNKLEMPLGAKRNALDGRDARPIPLYLRHFLGQYQLEAEWVVPYDHTVAESTRQGRPLSTVDLSSQLMCCMEGLTKHLMMLVNG